MKRLILGALAGAAIVCAAIAAGKYYLSLDAIPAVKTWGELWRRPAIDLGNGITVRLGLEAKSCPAGSGVLLYCLTEGYQPSGGKSVIDSEQRQVGPVFVRVSGPGESERDSVQEARAEWARVSSSRSAAPLFFATQLTLAQAGAYTIEVVGGQGESGVIARSRLRATGEEFHPWVPWSRVTEAMENGRLISGAGLPTCQGFGRTEAEAAGSRGKSSRIPLPTLLPAAIDPDLKIERTDGGIRVTSSRDLDGSEKCFLSRWWVNGRTFRPEAVHFGEAWMVGGQDRGAKEHVLPLDFEARCLGAIQGDRVELQLLYCPGGWTQVSWPPLEDLQRLQRKDDTVPRLSNRIEFTLEPDPPPARP